MSESLELKNKKAFAVSEVIGQLEKAMSENDYFADADKLYPLVELLGGDKYVLSSYLSNSESGFELVNTYLIMLVIKSVINQK